MAKISPELQELERRTQEIEDTREAKKAEREEKKRLKELHQRRLHQEKMVAPVLLILTLLVSVAVYYFSRMK